MVRITTPHIPCRPRPLERLAMPLVERIVATIRESLS